MIGAGGKDQQSFGQRVPAARRAIDQQLADFLRARRAARLARGHGRDAACFQCRGEALDLGGFAGALAAFKGDEAPACAFTCCAEHACDPDHAADIGPARHRLRRHRPARSGRESPAR